MPTYQYSCTDCGHFFEAHQTFSEDSLTVCPECGGKLRKVFNAVGVVFKGSGFYRTDSRGGSSSSDGGSTSSSTSSDSSSSSSSSGSGDAASSNGSSSASTSSTSSGASTSANSAS